MPAPELTIDDLLRQRRRLFFGPLGKDGALGTAQQGVIFIDPRARSPLARTLLHELIHVARPTWSESKVLACERNLWGAATWRQKAALTIALGKGKVWEGEEEFPDEDVRGGSVRPEHGGEASAVDPGVDPDVQGAEAAGVGRTVPGA